MKKIALLGYRHIHIADLKKRAENHPRASFVALCEENPATSLLSSDKATATHQNFESLLREVDFEILGLGDCYGKRGHQAIRASRWARVSATTELAELISTVTPSSAADEVLASAGAVTIKPRTTSQSVLFIGRGGVLLIKLDNQ